MSGLRLLLDRIHLRARNQWVDWPSLLPSVLLALASTAAYLTRGWHSVAVVALTLGFAVAAALEMWGGRVDTAVHLWFATVMMVGVLAGPRWALACTLAFGLGSLGLPARQPEHALILRELGFAAALVWILGGSIAQALLRAEASEQRSWLNAREAQQRRGELQRTSKALRDMYALLERTNRELEVARREAEEAKEIKARFAANISHELRTPLNLIMGFSHMMYRSRGVRRRALAARAARRHPRDPRRQPPPAGHDRRHPRPVAHRRPAAAAQAGVTDMAALVQEAGSHWRGLLRGRACAHEVDVPGDLPRSGGPHAHPPGAAQPAQQRHPLHRRGAITSPPGSWRRRDRGLR